MFLVCAWRQSLRCTNYESQAQLVSDILTAKTTGYCCSPTRTLRTCQTRFSPRLSLLFQGLGSVITGQKPHRIKPVSWPVQAARAILRTDAIAVRC